jgi:hypothetical protein
MRISAFGSSTRFGVRLMKDSGVVGDAAAPIKTDEVWDPGDESKENSGYSDRCLLNLSLDEHHDVVLIGPL